MKAITKERALIKPVKKPKGRDWVAVPCDICGVTVAWARQVGPDYAYHWECKEAVRDAAIYEAYERERKRRRSEPIRR